MKKPLHKHIHHRAKKVTSHFTKYLYERDTIFATIWVFLFIVILGSIPLNLGSMNPVKLSLKDFDFNDLTYSKLQEDNTRPVDKRISVVNIGFADREGIAMMIEKAATYGPRVMALDAFFDEAKDPRQDSILTETFKRHSNLVAAQKLIVSGPDADTITTAGDYIKGAHQYAYVNFFTDKFASVRSYEPFEKDWKKVLYSSFSSEIVRLYDSTAFKRLKKRGNSRTLINYTKNQNKIPIIQMDQLMTDNFDSSWVKDRILLFGYIAPENNPEDITDKFFTPMNPKWYGKSWPDMHGIIVHANIISMALDDNYIKKLPLWLNWLIAIVVCWLHMSFFIRYYLESHIWFHLVAKILQVASAIFFVWLGIYLFDKYRLKVDFKMSLLVIVLAVDVIYFYEAFAVWMHKKYNYKTVFKPHHH
jgi:CHASE2 domain-containing sensor protein